MIIRTPSELIPILVAMVKDGDEQKYELRIHREKRSLTQNGYYWQLLTQTAHVLGISNTELHNRMLAEYGFLDDVIQSIIMDDEVDWTKIEHLHLRPTTRTKVMANGRLYRVFYVMRGSSSYNTKEMSRLVDGMVQEAKQQGIETITPARLAQIRRDEEEAERRARLRRETEEAEKRERGKMEKH